ncbi:hypothetical protein ACIGHJ_11570 [Stutzerimonas kunmingensis]|uniref:hypothetical protein n=1 Tax=Stutzerimonas stutzeri subgroup TaxID=578833 RepID=UPI0037D63DFC
MAFLRTNVALLLITLVGSNVMAANDEADDPAPSGNEQSHVTVGETGAVAGPGRDYGNGDDDARSTSHDLTDWSGSSEDDTSVDYPDPVDTNGE